MRPKIKRYKFSFAKQDPFAVWEAKPWNRGLGSRGHFSDFVRRRFNRTGKDYQNLKENHAKKMDQGFNGPDQKTLVKALTQVINELPLQEKTMLSLHYCEGLDFKQIGEVLDCSEQKAMKLFRDSLKKVTVKMRLKTTH